MRSVWSHCPGQDGRIEHPKRLLQLCDDSVGSSAALNSRHQAQLKGRYGTPVSVIAGPLETRVTDSLFNLEARIIPLLPVRALHDFQDSDAVNIGARDDGWCCHPDCDDAPFLQDEGIVPAQPGAAIYQPVARCRVTFLTASPPIMWRLT
ncbi:MAG: hypothetical protein PVG72_01390 [Gammaproteobacteria bacterium]|jgi:hypothetical protein